MIELEDRIRQEEGYRTHLYEDSEGVLSIGIGYNIDEKGLPDDIIQELLKRTLSEATADAQRIPEYNRLNDSRRSVLVAMVFQLGLPSVLKFVGMRLAIRRGDYNQAAAEMLDSRWHKQTPARAEREAKIMRQGI